MPRSELRWRRRKEARPQEILEAALAVFAEKGFAATRMDEIAQRAGVTKGTIYLYFDSKEEVFKSLVRQSIGETIARVAENAKAFQGSAKDLLLFVIRTIGIFLRTSDRAVLPKIVLAEAGNFPELLRFYRFEVIERGMALLSSIVARGIEQEEFRKVPVEHAVRLCIAPLLLGALWRTTFAQFDSEPYDLNGLVEAHIDVLLHGLAKEDTGA